jgi:hypothetical protein
LTIGGWLIGRGPADLSLGANHVPSPYPLLQTLVPGFDAVRLPGRILVVAQLGIALLAAAGANRLLRSVSGPRQWSAAVRPVAASADEGIRRTSENAFIVDRREIAGAVDNMSGLLTQLRAVGEVRDGRPAGFRLFQIKGGSLFARLGLRDGDVVQRVNGTAVAEPAALLAFLSRLGKEPRVALDIVRDDTPRTLVYDLR